MKTLYFECSMGAAADTIAAALIELVENKEQIINTINSLRNDEINLKLKTIESCGSRGTGLFTTGHSGRNTEGEEERRENRHHRVLRDILNVIDDMPLNGRVRENVLGIVNLIAESVAEVKGVPKEEAHLHSLASIDNILMIVTVCVIIDEIAPEYIVSSPVCLGMGYTHSIYGTVPVPTPPTSYLMTDVPTYAGKFEGELCTTTGAAILKWFVKAFEQMPKMSVKQIGCGIGKEKYASANCLRAFWGEIISTGANDELVELVCTIKDMAAEEISFVQKLLTEQGAEEVYTFSIYTGNNCHGVKLTCICENDSADELAQVILKNTSVTYVRRTSYMAYMLKAADTVKNTSYGEVRAKCFSGYGIERINLVYDDIEKIAAENNISVREVRNKVLNEIK